ncbi:hypothetical protein ACFV2S_30910 [Streptomyces sp. NPDC059695]|uniref:hypothetical protein n=1 Tax=Streptomyces sp. NPDC059695 TaxID=3346910 RepID=UPI0036C69DC3
MSHHDPGAAGPRRARRRHAPARRGRGALWLLAGGGATVLGLAAALLAGGLGTGGGTRSPAEGGADGPPVMIQADPSDGTPGTPGEGASGTSAVPVGDGSAPGGRTGTPSVKTTATAAPSGSTPPVPDAPRTSPPAATASPTAPDAERPGKPGKGRGAGKRPR